MLVKPNLTFNGNAEEVIKYYQTILQAEVSDLCRCKNYPDNPKFANYNEKDLQRILNATLTFAGTQFNISDTLPNQPYTFGNNIVLDLVVDNETDARHISESFAKEGKTIIPLTPASWCANFGIFEDKFGIIWNIMQSPELNH